MGAKQQAALDKQRFTGGGRECKSEKDVDF